MQLLRIAGELTLASLSPGGPTKFDSSVIKRILNRAEHRTGAGVETDVEIAALQPGMVVLEDVLSASRQCLLRAGSTLSSMSINYLKQWHGKDPIPPKLRVRLAE